MEKISSTSDLIINQNYLLINKNEGVSVKVLYVGCALGQWTKVEDETFGDEYNIVFPNNSIRQAYEYTRAHPCYGEIVKDQIQLYFFRSPSNIEEESLWAFNLVYSNNPNIPSTIQNFQLYSYSAMEIISDEDMKCYWENADAPMRQYIFDILIMSAEQAESSAKTTPFGSQRSITDAVKTGIFTSKISRVQNIQNPNIGGQLWQGWWGCPIVNIHGFDMNSVKGWYDLANKLAGILYIQGQQYWCVYRVVKDIDIVLTDRMIQPLPFSSTYHLNWLKTNWSGENLCCLLKILIPFDAPMVVIEPPDQEMYKGRHSQYEIVLPAGVLHRQSINQDKNGLIFSQYILEQWSYETCVEYLSEYNTSNFPPP